MRLPCLLVFALIFGAKNSAWAQLDAAFPSPSVNYKIISDDPHDLNFLWIQVQPITIDGGQMNLAVGSGLDLTYLPMKNLELRGSIRGNLINSLDFQRFASGQGASITWQESKREQSQMNLTNSYNRFYCWEIGGTYALKDIEKTGGSKIILNENPVPGNTSFPEMIEVDTKIRQTWGLRLGLRSMSSTVSLQNSLEKQDVALVGNYGTILDKAGTRSSNGFSTPGNKNALFSNFSSTGFAIGGSLQKIKNISIKTDKQGILSNNSIITFYGDVLINPWTRLEDLKAQWKSSPTSETFATDKINLSQIGGRIGAEVRYNQAFFISMGAELGYQPCIQGEGFYGLLKLSFPTFSFGNTRAKVATNVGKNQSLTQ